MVSAFLCRAYNVAAAMEANPLVSIGVRALIKNGRGRGLVMKGSIRSLVRDKGYGFIQGEDGQDYFFHKSACIEGEFYEFEIGDPVLFTPNRAATGLQAEAVSTAITEEDARMTRPSAFAATAIGNPAQQTQTVTSGSDVVER